MPFLLSHLNRQDSFYLFQNQHWVFTHSSKRWSFLSDVSTLRLYRGKEIMRMMNKYDAELDYSEKEERRLNPKASTSKYKGATHTLSGKRASCILEPQRKSKLHLGTFGPAMEDVPCVQLNEAHDQDSPTLIINVSSSDFPNSSIPGHPFVNVKRRARTPVVIRGDGSRKSRCAKLVAKEFVDLDQKDEASSPMPFHTVDVKRKKSRQRVAHRRNSKRSRAHPEGLNKSKGVRQRHSGKWGAEIWEPCMRTMLWLGTFNSEMEAALAYDEAAIAMYGSCASLNFPNYSRLINFPNYSRSQHSPSCIVISSSDSSIAEVHPDNDKPIDEGGKDMGVVDLESKRKEVGKASAEEESCDQICLLGEMFEIDEVHDALTGLSPPDFGDEFDFLSWEGEDEETMMIT